MNKPAVNHLPQKHQKTVLAAWRKVLLAENKPGYPEAVELYGDALEAVGMHTDGRCVFEYIIRKTKHTLIKARCGRKIAASHMSQRNMTDALQVITSTLQAFENTGNRSEAETEEYIRLLNTAGFIYYFNFKLPQLSNCVREAKEHINKTCDPSLRIQFYNIVGLEMMFKYRWYNLPEEAFTFADLQLNTANEHGDIAQIAYAQSCVGLIHLWNKQLQTAEENFKKVIDMLEGKHFNTLLIGYTYTTICYRMRGNVGMVEQWASLTLAKATECENAQYIANSYANLAWVYAKRKNWLYAEEYARKANYNMFSPMLYLWAFPLIECLLQKKDVCQAGSIAYKLLHPKLKGLPAPLTEKLRQVAPAWIKTDRPALAEALEDMITEAKITGYY